MDYKKLRRDLEDYYGTAMFGGLPMAIIELSNVKKMSEDELVKLAKKVGFNINKYKNK